MTQVPLMFQPLVKYVDFEGRARRSEFWLWILFRYLLSSGLGAIYASVMLSNLGPLFSNPNPSEQEVMSHLGGMMTMMPLLSLVNLALLLPTYAVCVRRLHDIGRTGWWLVMPIAVASVSLILFFIFFGFQIFSIAGKGDHLSDAEGLKLAFSLFGGLALCMIPILIAEIVMLVFYITEGKRGPNRFGPDPKGEALNETP